MAGRWETLRLLLCELPLSVCAETVDQQREEVQDKNRRGLQVQERDHFVVCLSNRKLFFFQMEVKRIMG